MAKKNQEVGCSFCGQGKDDVPALVSGPNALICSECVGQCRSIFAEHGVKLPEADDIAPFLRDPNHHEARETLLRHRLLYFLKAAAAIGGQDLNVFLTDPAGCDLVLADRNYLHRLHVSTVVGTGDGHGHSLPKGHFRARPDAAADLGLPADLFSAGQESGVLVQDVHCDERLDLVYRYTDVFVLAMFVHGVVSVGRTVLGSVVDRTWKELAAGSPDSLVQVPDAAFLTVLDVRSLLTILALGDERSDWRMHLRAGLRKRANGDDGWREDIEQVRAKLSGLVVEELSLVPEVAAPAESSAESEERAGTNPPSATPPKRHRTRATKKNHTK